jgi:GNAT superfamily N-acetyltransferase
VSQFQLAPLDARHDCAAFNSNSESLNRYLREQVTQDVRRRMVACFVALADGKRIAGYYTLASASLLLADLPASTGKKLPRHPTVRMGRLAVDRTFKGQGLGGALLADALVWNVLWSKNGLYYRSQDFLHQCPMRNNRATSTYPNTHFPLVHRRSYPGPNELCDGDVPPGGYSPYRQP